MYSCVSNPYKNVFNTFNFSNIKFTLTSKQNNFNDAVLLLAIIKLLLNKTSTLKIVSFNLTKKIIIQSSFTKLKSILLFNNFIFNFTFFNQQKFLFANTVNFFFFTQFDVAAFSFFNKFYKFVYNAPKIHISFKFNICNINNKLIARFLRLPVF